MQNTLKKLEEKTEISQKKSCFLETLRSPSNSKKFKRYSISPLRYAGGKSLAVGYVVQNLPNHIKRVISPFLGGGSIEIAIIKELGLPVIASDIFDILVNYWNVQIKNPKKLYDKLLELEPTKETYNQIKGQLKQHWKQEKKMNSLDLATTYFFNHNLSYGPSFLGWMSSNYLDKNRYKRMIERVRDFKMDKLKVSCQSFEKVIPKYNKDFLYCDPPYFLEGDSKMFKGIYPQRNFPIHHNQFQHQLLRDLLKKHKGGFILSYNDCSVIRDWYRDCEIVEVSWQYTLGQGETRIGENRIENGIGHVKKSHEIMIIKK